MSENKMKAAEENMIKNLEEKTGKKFAEWIKIANSSGAAKHGEIVNILKSQHGLTHGYANLVAHKAKQSDAGSTENSADLVNIQYKGKEEMFPLYEKIMKSVSAFGKDVEVSPKKAYVSLRRKKQFALIQPSTKTRLDIGLNIKGEKPAGILEASGSFNAMCTHRIRIEDASGINSDVVNWLKKAYEQAG
jgi:predicted transport protein